MVVYTRKGLIQTSYLSSSPRDRKQWPTCCSVSIDAGGTVSVTLPTQRYAIGYVELVSLMTYRDGRPQVLPAEVTCDLRAGSCRTTAVS